MGLLTFKFTFKKECPVMQQWLTLQLDLLQKEVAYFNFIFLCELYLVYIQHKNVFCNWCWQGKVNLTKIECCLTSVFINYNCINYFDWFDHSWELLCNPSCFGGICYLPKNFPKMYDTFTKIFCHSRTKWSSLHFSYQNKCRSWIILWCSMLDCYEGDFM